MGRILSDEEAAEIRSLAARVDEHHVNVGSLALEYGVSTTTINNILADLSYRRPACYPAGSQGRSDAEQRQRDYEANQKRKQQMRYVSSAKRKEVLERDGYRCVYCSADLRTEPLAVDHKVPVSAGGTNEVNNLQATCRSCNARKKEFTSPDGDIRRYLDRRREIDRISNKVGAILPQTVASLVWSDKEDATCPWCGAVANHVKEKAYVGSDDKLTTYDVELDHAFVWRCKPCRRYFTVSNEWFSGLSDFKYNLESVIWGRAYSGYGGMDEVTSIVSAIVSDSDTQTVRALVASWAGEIVEVKRRRHTHSRNGDLWEPSPCWCEYGLPSFKATDRTYKQTELVATCGIVV